MTIKTKNETKYNNNKTYEHAYRFFRWIIFCRILILVQIGLSWILRFFAFDFSFILLETIRKAKQCATHKSIRTAWSPSSSPAIIRKHDDLIGLLFGWLHLSGSWASRFSSKPHPAPIQRHKLRQPLQQAPRLETRLPTRLASQPRNQQKTLLSLPAHFTRTAPNKMHVRLC